MGTENQDFFKWKKDSFFLQVIIEDAQVDLSDYKAYWAMALGPTYSPVLVKTTSGHFGDIGGITWITGNSVRIQIDAADTESLEIDEYYHELAIEDGQGKSVVVATGTFDLRQAIFHSRD
jgi:hypothetical protein